MPFIWPSKDPDEVLDYAHNWSARIGEDDTVDSTQVVLTKGDVVVDSQSYSDPWQTVWLSGGTNNTRVELTLRATTTGGRVYDEGIHLRIRHRR